MNIMRFGRSDPKVIQYTYISASTNFVKTNVWIGF